MLYALLGLLFAIHVSMALGRSINWDEFWFYNQIQVVARREFIQPLQTIHTRFFAPWLPNLPGSEIDHILIARFFMLACLAVTSASIYAIVVAFSTGRTALLVTAAYLGAGFVLQHGTSFRVDPIVTAFLSVGLAIAARTRLSIPAIIALGLTIGIAAMVTIKMVLWAPAFAGMALWRWQDEGWDWRYPLRWLGAGGIALLVFGGLYLLHGTGGNEAAAASASGTLNRSAGKMFGFLSSPNLDMALKAITTGLPLAIMAALVPWKALAIDVNRTRRIAILAMWLPALTPLYYYNSYPYFFAFILPPVAITCAFVLPMFVDRYGQTLVAAAIAGSALMVWTVDARGITHHQRQLNTAVHQSFPEPVRYFDCCGMIATFTKENDFRTSWGIEKYLRANRPTLLERMREVPVPLLLDNKREFAGADGIVNARTLHPEDAAALANTYIRLWGDIFVAGRKLPPAAMSEWEVLVPGAYRIDGMITINGNVHADGTVVELPRGDILLENRGDVDARIIWGVHTREPQLEEPDLYWTSF